VFAALEHRLRDPITWSHVSQVVKTALAAVIAWLVSARILHVAQPFLAPWAALLTVHATIFGSVKRGLRQAVAAVLGVLLAFGLGHVFGLNALSLGLATLLGLMAGSLRGMRADSTTVAATAIIVLTTGYSDNGGMLGSRLLDTAIGIATGLLVNLIVWPPLRDRGAASQIEAVSGRIGALLGEVAQQLRRGCRDSGPEDWISATDDLDADLDRAWAILQQARESGRMNPRPAAPDRMRATEGLRSVLDQLSQAVAETRSMARTIGLARRPPDRWPGQFHRPFVALLDRAGAAIAAADTAAVSGVRTELEAFAEELPVDRLPDGFWPLTGALIVNLRNILEALAGVADARPTRVPARRPAVDGVAASRASSLCGS
jgi:predicted secreted protein